MKLAAARLTSFVTGSTLDNYKSNQMLKAAVERQFEIMGEAINQMIQLDPSLKSRITSAGQITAFRNKLIHNYWMISDELVWEIIEHHLPILQKEIDILLAECEPPPESAPAPEPS